MKSTARSCIFAIAFTAINCVGIVDDVEAGNGWGWAKPLNQKPGSVLYTLNRKNRGNTKSRHTTSLRSNHVPTYAQPESIPPNCYPYVTVQSPAVIVGSTPANEIPGQPVLGGRVIHSQTPPVAPPTKAPSMLDGWLVP